jgi:DNA integrity scanning protein DisA with diadenylate cyclase activity
MDPIETGKALVMLAGLAGLYLKVNQAVRAMAGKGEAREISNNPLNVQETSRPATIDDVNRVDQRVSKLERRIERHMQESTDQREDVRESITDLRDRMDDKFSLVTEDIKEISRAIGRLEGS